MKTLRSTAACTTASLTVIAAMALAGCTRQVNVGVGVDPPKITLTAALTDVVEALNAARAKSAEYNERIGLNPCTVTATFNVAAKGDEKTGFKLGVTASPPVIPVGLSANGEYSTSLEASRGNQIVVQLTSPACLADKTLGATAPEKIALAQEQITKARGEGPPYRVQDVGRKNIDPYWRYGPSERVRERIGSQPGNAGGDGRNDR